MTPKFANHEDARRAGYHSRRHESRKEQDESRRAYQGKRKPVKPTNRAPEEQLKRLDAMFGAGKGATKERAKLAKKLEKKV